MKTSLTRFAAVAALAVVTGTACALEVGVARHSHPGPEVGYIVAGDIEFRFDDRPTQYVHTGARSSSRPA